MPALRHSVSLWTDRGLRDLRQALRGLARARGFSAVAVLSLGLGVGAATALFSLVHGVLLRPLAYQQPERLVLVREALPQVADLYPTMPANLQHFRAWKEEARSFAGMAAFKPGSATLTGAGEPRIVELAEATHDLFSVLGVRPAAGRSFLPAEEQPGRNRVVVVTDGLWRRAFGGSPHLLGSAILLDGIPHTVVGILPPSFRFPRKEDLGALARLSERTELFRPIGVAPRGWTGDYDYNVFARLRPGVSPARAEAELDVLERRIAAAHDAGAGLHASVAPLTEVLTGPVRTGLYALLGAVGMLLLIVCANLANLELARASARSRELAVRAALGASRASLIGQAAAESLFLAVLGGLLGLGLARAGLAAFVAAAPVDLPRLDEVRLDTPVLLFGLTLALLCGLVAGLVPALRTSAADPQSTLRAGGPTASESRPALRLRELLVGYEVALSAVLLLLAGLLTASLFQLLRVDRGFTAERAVAVHLTLPASRYPGAAERNAFFERALAGLRTIPGVRSAALVSKLPLTGEASVATIQLAGEPRPAADAASGDMILANVRFVSPEYFSTLGIPLLAGRGIEPADRDRAVAVVSARLAAKLWPGRPALGRRFSTGARVGEVEVVGVVGDVRSVRLEEDPTLMVYAPYWKRGPESADLVVETAADPGAALPLVRQRIAAIDPGVAVPPLATLSEIVANTLSRRRFQVELAGGFALAALLLAAVGIYGVVSYGVAQRRTEIGIRMALGARVGQVTGQVLARGLRPALLGLAGGLAAALAGARLIRSLLYGVAPTDPATLLAVALLLAGIAATACLVPALAAARTDPAVVLRRE